METCYGNFFLGYTFPLFPATGIKFTSGCIWGFGVNPAVQGKLLVQFHLGVIGLVNRALNLNRDNELHEEINGLK